MRLSEAFNYFRMMVYVLRNISNIRSHESMVIVQPNGLVIEKECVPTKEPFSHIYTIWKSVAEWVNNLVEQGHLSSILELETTSNYTVINMIDGSVIHLV
jgi:predicted regulator of Ras-like GTPase activity (Roadblock/LC7/MglB family)